MPDGMRTPSVTLLLGQHGWVEHVDNGIRWAAAAGYGWCGEGTALTIRVGSSRYTFDVTKCMFSTGNITEKLRVASLPCSGEVVVDLYAGNRDGGGGGSRCCWHPGRHEMSFLAWNVKYSGLELLSRL